MSVGNWWADHDLFSLLIGVDSDYSFYYYLINVCTGGVKVQSRIKTEINLAYEYPVDARC